MANNASSQIDETGVTVVYKDEVTQKKIHDHLNNENDIITEQDIANINTGITQENHSELIVLTDLQEVPKKDSAEIDVEEDIEEKVVKDNRDADVNTSWNILGS